MVTFELLNESAEDLLYAYHPEGDRHHGAHYAHRLATHLAASPDPDPSGTLA